MDRSLSPSYSWLSPSEFKIGTEKERSTVECNMSAEDSSAVMLMLCFALLHLLLVGFFVCFSILYGQETKSKLISEREKIEADTKRGIIPSPCYPQMFPKKEIFIPTLSLLRDSFKSLNPTLLSQHLRVSVFETKNFNNQYKEKFFLPRM